MQRLSISLDRAVSIRYIPGSLIVSLLGLLGLLGLVARIYDVSFAQRPYLTSAVTSATLGGISDVLAQIITTINKTKNPRLIGRSARHALPPLNLARPYVSLDTRRLLRFMSYFFLFGVIQQSKRTVNAEKFAWLKFLALAFPLESTAHASYTFLKLELSFTQKCWVIIQRVICDQLIYSPITLAFFLVCMAVLDNQGIRLAVRNMRLQFGPIFKANLLIWPALQLINMAYMPLDYQGPFMQFFNVFWNVFLSIKSTRSVSEDVEMLPMSEEK